MRLQNRIPLITLPLVGLPLLIVGLVAYLHLENGARQQAATQVHLQLEQMHGRAQALLRTARANAELFAHYPLLRYFLTTQDQEERYALIQRPLYRKLQAIQRAFPEYYEIRVLQPDGQEALRVTNRTIPHLRRNDPSPAFLQQVQHTASGDLARLTLDGNTGQPALRVYRPLRYGDNRSLQPERPTALSGFLVLGVSLDPLQRLLESNPVGKRGGLMLVDNQGAPLLRPERLRFTQTLPSPPQTAATADLQRVEARGETWLYQSRPLHQGVHLMALLPESELHTQSYVIGKLAGLVTLVALLLSLLLMYWLTRIHFLDPMQKLLKGVRSVARGDLDYRLPAERQDEFGELGQAFNRMSAQLRRFQHRIHAIAFHDPLTGLPNRALFSRQLQRLMNDTQERRKRMALLFLDLDNFKHINDSQGHQTGDTLLRIVARRLEENLRGSDLIARNGSNAEPHTLARLGGDEFTILVPDILSASQVVRIAQRIINTLAQPVTINDLEFYVGASLGITLYPGDGHSPEELIKNADLAMYQAKRLGKSNFQFYSETISDESVARIHLEQRLHKAVDNGAFELHFQPIVSASDTEVISLEALIRWHDEGYGSVSPSRFIPLAEESGLIIKIGSWVLEAACQQLKAWRAQGLCSIRVAVNVSGVQLNKTDLCLELKTLLQRYQLPPESLYLELTESAILEGHDKAMEVLKQLRAQGILIALDDFGTGYSSLSYLRNLPIDLLKIDRSFVCEINPVHPPVILASIIEMAHSLELKVIAEGVETDEQLEYLRARHCDLIQGFLFSAPRPAAEIPALIKRLSTQRRLKALPS